jgi:predicted amidohydrolase YtcJ
VSATLYTGADVVTLDADRPHATAIATAGDRIAAVGDEAECRAALRGTDFDAVDLRGACVVPGFIDTHLHPIAQIYFDMHADLRGAASIADVQAALRRAADRLPPDEWLVGLQLEDADLAERRLPTRRELDAACPERPVVVVKRDGHSASGNARALALAGIDGSTPDPDGGRIEREPDGTPSGPCREAAGWRLVGAVPPPSLDRLHATAGATFARFAACGITTAGVVLQTDDEGPGGSAGSLESVALQVLLDVVPFATYAILAGRNVDAAVAARTSPLHDPARGRRVGGFKIFADGTFGSCTACMRQPFSDHPEQRGAMTLADDDILERMRRADAAGFQICVHTIGDGAVERCVGLFEQLLAGRERSDHRHRLEHASLVPPELIPRMAALGLAVSTQPLFIRSERHWLHRRLGRERARHAYPLRALLDAGLLVAGASDAPVESVRVLDAIECCVTRDGFETHQGITPLEALKLFTIDAARAQHDEHETGSLVAGKRADLVVLDRNPLLVAPGDIGRLAVLRTVAGGRVVHDLLSTEHP